MSEPKEADDSNSSLFIFFHLRVSVKCDFSLYFYRFDRSGRFESAEERK